jgi:hypothetical protein
MYTDTKPIRIFNRDDVARQSGAGDTAKLESEAVDSAKSALPESLEEATEVLIKQFMEEQKQNAARSELEAAQLQVIEQTVLPTPAEDEIVPAFSYVSQSEFSDLKNQINDSLGELANLMLEHQRMIEQINERMSLFNQRSGQKI